MKMRYKLVIVFGVILLLLLAGHIFRWDRFGLSQISWEDFLVYDHETYVAVHMEDWSRCPVEETKVGDEVGKVRFTLEGNVQSIHYKHRNYDASYLAKGTKIYRLKESLDKKQLAVYVDGEYYLYELKVYE